ncbi:MAG: iron-sulfur cluster carrier protein ApbC [Bacteroidetes bacterium]|jgi:ATP-binding protein involved in chromosome partitioning|nr:iron-sulfur cluster carrier protein ApbC [Bacteroidota bacterium]
MLSLNEQNILQSLRAVRDPDLHRDIVTLGFVKNLTISDGDVAFDLVLTTPSCPVRDQFVIDCEKAIRTSIDGVRKVDVRLSSSVTTHTHAQKESVLPGVKNTIAVASGKGGVGKSTVAVNLAVSLAMDGAKVGLVDADIYGPSIPTMFGINERPRVSQNKLYPLEKYGVKVMSIGFLVDPMQAVIWRGPMASGAVKQFMGDVEWGELDYLIFDLPPGTGDIQLTIVQTIPLTGAVIVTTPQDVALADARKGLVMFNKVNVPVLGIVENMSHFICSHCGQREDIFDSGGGKRTATELHVPFLGEIPIDTKIRVGGDSGHPVVHGEPTSPRSEIIRNIARQLAAQVSIRNVDGIQAPKLEILLGPRN